MAYQAIQSFSAEFPDGRPALAVNKGEVFPDGHELVRRDMDTSGGRAAGQLFKKLDLGEEPPKSAPQAQEESQQGSAPEPHAAPAAPAPAAKPPAAAAPAPATGARAGKAPQ